MSISASKVHIKVAQENIAHAAGSEDQATVIGRLDLSIAALGQAKREAMAQPKRKVEPAEIPGQEKLPMPPNAVGVASDGVVRTPADTPDF